MSQSSNHVEHDSEFIVHKWLPSHKISIFPNPFRYGRTRDSRFCINHVIPSCPNGPKCLKNISRIFPEPCCVVAWAVLKAEGVKCMCFRQCTHLFSALVRLPVHSLTSRGHSQGHSHSFCSILNSKQLNSRSVRNLYSQFDSDLMFA